MRPASRAGPDWPAEAAGRALRVLGKQVGLESLTDAGFGRAAVVLDQHGAGAAPPGAPGPGQIADTVRVGPVDQLLHVVEAAVVLAELADDDRHLLRERSDLGVPTRLAGAGVEAV